MHAGAYASFGRGSVIDQPLGRGASRSARLRDLAASRAAAAPVALVALIGLSVLVRSLLAQQIPVPFIFGDELLHGELARSVLEHGTFDVRGHGVTISFTYPLALAPAWLAGSVSTAYTLMKVVNALLMSLAAVPVYLWGRRFLSPLGALVAAALTLLLPGLVLTGTLMTENAFFPAFLLALLAIGVCVERPTPGRQALAVGGDRARRARRGCRGSCSCRCWSRRSCSSACSRGARARRRGRCSRSGRRRRSSVRRSSSTWS